MKRNQPLIVLGGGDFWISPSPLHAKSTYSETEPRTYEIESKRNYFKKDAIHDGNSTEEAEPIHNWLVRLFRISGYAIHL